MTVNAMVSEAHPTRRIAMLLLNNSGSGGAERRYAQVYELLRKRDTAISLIINESLWADLLRAGVLSENAGDVIVKERFRKFAKILLNMGNYAEDGLATSGHLVQTTLRAIAFGLRKLDYATGCLTVGWWILRHHPNVVHLVLGGAYIMLPLQLLRCAPPAVVSVVCPSLRGMVGTGAGYRLYRVALRLAHRIDALTGPIRQALQQEGISNEAIRVAPGSFVNTSRFTHAHVKRPWVVFVGRLVPEKNPDQFVAVCALVHRRMPNAKFFVLGDGPLRGQVRALVNQYGLESCTEMRWCDRVELVLQHALVFVSMQTMDNYPSQALLEAMACGAAVVATDVGQTRKLVDETVGILVDTNLETIAEAVVHLLQNPEQAALKGRWGRQRVVEQHSAERYVDYLQQMYDELSLVGMEKT